MKQVDALKKTLIIAKSYWHMGMANYLEVYWFQNDTLDADSV
jgi:hypothetical protein